MDASKLRDFREKQTALFAHFLSIQLSSQHGLSEQKRAALTRETDELVYRLKHPTDHPAELRAFGQPRDSRTLR